MRRSRYCSTSPSFCARLVARIAQRRGGQDRGRKRLDLLAHRRIEAALAHGPGDVLDALGRGKNIRGGGRGRIRRLRGKPAARRRFRLDPGDLGARLGDRLGHFEEVDAEALKGFAAAVAADDGLDALDGIEQEPGIGVAVAAREFAEEPAAARAAHDRRADGVVVALRRTRQWHCGQCEWFFRHGETDREFTISTIGHPAQSA